MKPSAVRAALCALALAAAAQPAAAEITTRLDCGLHVERAEGQIAVSALMRADRPTRADYRLTTLHRQPGDLGATESLGSQTLETGAIVRTGLRQFELSGEGWIEFRLEVYDRRTGSRCEATRRVDRAL